MRRYLFSMLLATTMFAAPILAAERVAPPPPMMFDGKAAQNAQAVSAPAPDLPVIESMTVRELESKMKPAPIQPVKRGAHATSDQIDDAAGVTLADLIAGQQTGPDLPLEEALRAAYQTNPTLRAARATVKSTYEELPGALSGWMPRVNMNAGLDARRNAPDPGSSASGTEVSAGLTATQPLYRGGKTMASVRAAQSLIDAQLAVLASTERNILYTTAQTYMDLLRAQAALRVQIKNRDVILRQLTATQDRFRVGDLTRTDVAQAEFRLARARADVTAAEGDVQSTRAVFEQLVGQEPGTLNLPQMDFVFPKDKQDAITFAETYNSDVIASQARFAAARENVDVVFGDLLPDVSLNAGTSVLRGAASNVYDDLDSANIGVTFSMPLYEGGATRSRVRAAKYSANELQLRILESKRRAREETVRAWENLSAARAELTSRAAQVRAAEIARAGVRQEADLGERTILDALDADLEVRDGQIALITAKRNEIVARFALASSMGLLVPGNVGIDTPIFDFTAHADSVMGRVLSTDVTLDPVTVP